MNMRSIYRISFVGIPLLVLWGCADLKDELPTPTSPGVEVHQTGWANPASNNFHGNSIRGNNWDMRSCQTCHGSKYDGGTSGASCRDCHTNSAGPENCATCHGGDNPAPPRDLSKMTDRTARGVGAHQIHLAGGTLATGLPCSECHTVPPTVYGSPSHIDGTTGAEVHFSLALANTVTNEPGTADYDANLPLFSPAPVYSSGNLGCASSYCHGNFKNGNPGFVPVWNDPSGAQTACGTCHGDITRSTLAERALPKIDAEGGTHPNVTTCFACHGDVVDANTKIISKAKHMNGRLNVFGEERDY